MFSVGIRPGQFSEALDSLYYDSKSGWLTLRRSGAGTVQVHGGVVLGGNPIVVVPLRPITLGLAANASICFAILRTAGNARNVFRRIRRSSRSHPCCVSCGYDLSGLAAEIC